MLVSNVAGLPLVLVPLVLKLLGSITVKADGIPRAGSVSVLYKALLASLKDSLAPPINTFMSCALIFLLYSASNCRLVNKDFELASYTSRSLPYEPPGVNCNWRRLPKELLERTVPPNTPLTFKSFVIAYSALRLPKISSSLLFL